MVYSEYEHRRRKKSVWKFSQKCTITQFRTQTHSMSDEMKNENSPSFVQALWGNFKCVLCSLFSFRRRCLNLTNGCFDSFSRQMSELFFVDRRFIRGTKKINASILVWSSVYNIYTARQHRNGLVWPDFSILPAASVLFSIRSSINAVSGYENTFVSSLFFPKVPTWANDAPLCLHCPFTKQYRMLPERAPNWPKFSEPKATVQFAGKCIGNGNYWKAPACCCSYKVHWKCSGWGGSSISNFFLLPGVSESTFPHPLQKTGGVGVGGW